MRNPLLWLFFLLLWLIFGWWLWSLFVCPVVVADACSTWEIEDGNRLDYEAGNYVHFRRNSSAHLTDIPSATKGVETIVNHLKKNTDRSALITGYYTDNETNSNPLMNLGLARAQDIKRWMTSLGASASQIATASKIDSSCYRNDTLRQGAIVSFSDLKKDNNRLATIKNSLSTAPISLYFATGSDTPQISDSQRSAFRDLFYYLDNVPSARIEVGGHTDNTGELASNMTLSQSRAQDIRNYIQTHGGLPISRMDAVGYGPNQPKNPNDTPENMALNRRVEVILK